MRKPNIVWLTTDHQAFANHYHYQPQFEGKLEAYERLASEGRTYEEAYSVCPLCTPARASMVSGVYPHRHGMILNPPENKPYAYRLDFDSPFELFGEAMKQSGYRVAQFGKWYGGAKTAEELGFEGWTLPYYGRPLETEAYAAYLKRSGLPNPEVEVLWHATEPEIVGMKYDLTQHYQYAFGPFSAARRMTTPIEGHESYFTADMACQWLEEYERSGSSQPFVLKVDVWGPHHPYDTAAPFAGSIDPAALLKPPSFSDTYKNKPQNYRSTKEHWKCLDGMSWEEMSRVLAACYEHAMVVDSGLEKILNQLDTAGFLENTVVILTADHGDQLASHGGLFNKDTLMVEEVMKVPLVIRWPERVKAGEKDYTPVTNMDLVETVLELGGAEGLLATDGVSVLGEKRREHLMCETYGCYRYEFVQRMLRWKQYKYIAHCRDMDELYDLEKDPFEMENRIEDEGYRAVLGEMKMRLKNEMLLYGDTEGEAKEILRTL
ncbi:sulfatase-like hydrolase/transferase [Hungatella effluvii]|uniref:sulfatase-like hydrolase/transferase n=1 Tax=Hungatella effluvii TaxID=1096246 RepID=UPI0022E56C01|nr:sulfatase-like hydrolase/transferase [Hungatella effluvii]